MRIRGWRPNRKSLDILDISIDSDGDPERLETIELVRVSVAPYLIAERDRMTSGGLAAYVNANASIITDRSEVETVKVLLRGIDYSGRND
ncbi:MAG: hypothetical protein Q8Q52_03050 [Acidimicrobiia bacterium]|nr:hypothetical protein [Acidimicrobiia bacterium]